MGDDGPGACYTDLACRSALIQPASSNTTQRLRLKIVELACVPGGHGMNGKTCEGSETDPLFLLATKLIACGLGLPLASVAFTSPAIAETVAGPKVAQAEFQPKLRKGPIEA